MLHRRVNTGMAQELLDRTNRRPGLRLHRGKGPAHIIAPGGIRTPDLRIRNPYHPPLN